ncbi:MAG TPA: aspartate carbamoyltransferase [archaeon]|nr:aspartate carbamoyltransferase [archaeon]
MWDRKHLLDIECFSRGDFEGIFFMADGMVPISGIDKKKDRKRIYVANGDIMTVWFEPEYENSTRTSGSFEGAMMRLGGSCKKFNEKESSMSKGESVEDTARILSQHTDLIVDRHTDPKHVYRLAKAATVPVVNGGNGSYQHPTQTIQDFYTIRKRRGRVDGATIAIIGDMKNGRVVHSLCSGLLPFENVKVAGVHQEGYGLPKEFRPKFYESRQIDMSRLDKELADINPDIVYVTRPQTERGSAMQPYCVNANTMKCLRPDAMVMHALPRDSKSGPEIAYEVDADPRAAYFEQAAYGVPVRMAIISAIMDYDGKIRRASS